MNTTVKEKIKNKSDFFIQTKSGRIVHICEGTGDNLMPEDLEQGYVDYIYYDVYEDLNGLHDDNIVDGGMVLLEKLYKKLSIKDIIARVMDLSGEEYEN